VKLVFKHFPLSFHKNAQKAAEATMAAHAQGRFWDMHDILFENMKALEDDKLVAYAGQIGLDTEKFKQELQSGAYAARVKEDVAEGNRVGVRGTPTLFVNGRRYQPSGGYTVEGLEKVLAKHFGLKVKPAAGKAE
jgi:protein-disulfide isomerase